LLEGKNVNLRIVEEEDLPLLAEWTANSAFLGEYVAFWQKSKAEWQKKYESPSAEEKWFSIEKKDGTKVGFMEYFTIDNLLEIAYFLAPNERGKGYCTEAIQLIVDYLFLSKEIVRIQAQTDVRNVASQKVLEKSGFTKEGIIRKREFVRGEWRDRCLYSILRDEWKEPKILTKTDQD
jgi:RimJ/RimL family protein N-acetyltransferase